MQPYVLKAKGRQGSELECLGGFSCLILKKKTLPRTGDTNGLYRHHRSEAE